VLHWIIWSWYTGRWWVGFYIWYSEEGPGRAAVPPRPLLIVPNVTAHLSTASVPITVLWYDDPLLCSFMWRLKSVLNSFFFDAGQLHIELFLGCSCALTHSQQGSPAVTSRHFTPLYSLPMVLRLLSQAVQRLSQSLVSQHLDTRKHSVITWSRVKSPSWWFW